MASPEDRVSRLRRLLRFLSRRRAEVRIDDRPPTEADIRRAYELIEENGWEHLLEKR